MQKKKIKRIEIGVKNIKELTTDNLLSIARIELVHLSFDHWGPLEPIEFDTRTFSDTIVIDYKQKRLSDGITGRTIVLFFNYNDFTYHWHFEDDRLGSRPNTRINIETIKYLINEGFDLPLY